MNSKKIVNKKNFVIIIKVMMVMLSLLLVVSCVMGTEPNNTGTDNGGGIVDNGDDPVVPSDEDKIKAVLKEVKITNDSFNIFKLGEDPSEDELKAIGEKIETIFKNGNTASAWLGLSRKEGDNKLYLIAKDIEGTEPVDTINFMANLSSLQKACEDITKKYRPGLDITHHLISPTGNTDLCFESVKQVLEWRWQNMKKDFLDSSVSPPSENNTSNPFFFCDGSKPWLTFRTKVAAGVSKKVFYIRQETFYFAVETEVADPEVYFLNGGALSRAVDWTITFIKGGEIYSFRVGPYSIKEGDGPPYPYPPVIDDMLDPPYPEGLTIKDHYDKTVYHMFRLSSLVRLSLEKQLMDGGISADVAKEKADAYLLKELGFSKDSGFADLENWDIYLTFGEIYKGDYVNGMNPLGTFRNTFKLTGDDAKEFWKQ